MHLDATDGVLHVFVKAMQQPDGIHVKGVAYFDTMHGIEYCRDLAKRVAPGPWRGNTSAAPVFVARRAGMQPIVMHRDAEDPATPEYPCMPLLLRGTLQPSLEKWQLHVDGTAFVLPMPEAVQPTHPATPPKFFTLLGAPP